MIRHEGGRWVLYTKDGTRKLGAHATEAGAQAQERAVEAAKHMTNELRQLHLRGALGAPRTELWDGREHLVVPVVALMEGVIHAVNAKTPERVTTQVLAASQDKWNGHPLVVGHTTRDGRQVTAHDPSFEGQRFGFIRQAKMNGSRLGMEALVDAAKLEAMGQQRLLEDLRAGKPVDVSVGAYVRTSDAQGEHHGKKYLADWTEIAPDHLAFLPGGRGACSGEMGCGANRAAMHMVTAEGFEFQQEIQQMPKTLKDIKERVLALFDTPEQAASEEAAELIAYRALRALLDQAGASWDEMSSLVDALIADEEDNPTRTPAQEEAETEVEKARVVALQMLCMALSSALGGIMSMTSEVRAMNLPAPADPRYMAAFRAAVGKEISTKNMKTIQAAHDSAHAMHDHTTALGAACNGMKLLAATWCQSCGGTGQIKADGKQADCPACGGTGAEPRAAERDGTTAVEEDIMTADQKTAALKALATCGCDEAKIKGLDSDDKIVAAMLEQSEKHATALKVAQDAKDAAVAAEAKAKADLKAASEHVPTEEEWLKTAPASFRAMHAQKQAQDKAEHTGLVEKLLAASKTLSKEQLEAKSLDDLKTLAAFAKVDTVDYSGRGVAVPRSAASTEDFTPPKPYEAALKALQTAN